MNCYCRRDHGTDSHFGWRHFIPYRVRCESCVAAAGWAKDTSDREMTLCDVCAGNGIHPAPISEFYEKSNVQRI
jgi:hypothetical protein